MSKRVSLAISKTFDYGRGVLHGIRRYRPRQESWVFQNLVSLHPQVGAGFIQPWRPDGIIAHVTNESTARALLRIGKPVINTSNTIIKPSLPSVFTDDVAVGRMAAEHFLERGFESFALLGNRTQNYALQREEGFAQALRNAGFSYARLTEDDLSSAMIASDLPHVERILMPWLNALPLPTALFCISDQLAALVPQLCHQSGLRIPEDVALLGVNNDPVECELIDPPLSSIMLPLQKIGYEAASLLERMMHGEVALERPILLPPVGVVTRQSSDILAVRDADVSAAIAFIRQNCHQPLSVEDVLDKVSVSRRLLELKFKQILGRSPLEEIRRAHIQHAKYLLANTDLSLAAVAERSGLIRPQRLCAAFRENVGMTPNAYRNQYRLREH